MTLSQEQIEISGTQNLDQQQDAHLWDFVQRPVTMRETNIFLQPYSQKFLTGDPFMIECPLRQLLSPEDSSGLWALVGRKTNGDDITNEEFKLILFYHAPEDIEDPCIKVLQDRFNLYNEDKESIEKQVKNAMNMCIIGGGKEVIGAINFCHTMDGIWVNWLATSPNRFHKKNWGSFADNASFEKRGIGSFLIGKLWDLIEIVSLQVNDFQQLIYLQSIGSQDPISPYQFYFDRGFDIVENSGIEDGFTKLPETLQTSIKEGIKSGSFSFVFATAEDNADDKEANDEEEEPNTHWLLVCRRRPFRSTGKNRPTVLSIGATEIPSPILKGKRNLTRQHSPKRKPTKAEQDLEELVLGFWQVTKNDRAKTSTEILQKLRWHEEDSPDTLSTMLGRVQVVSRDVKTIRLQEYDSIANAIADPTKLGQILSIDASLLSKVDWIYPAEHTPVFPPIFLHEVHSIIGQKYLLGDMIRLCQSFLFRSINQEDAPFVLFDPEWYGNYIFNSNHHQGVTQYAKDVNYCWNLISKKRSINKSKEYWIIPRNSVRNNHWDLLVVLHPLKGSVSKKDPLVILWFDSIYRGSNRPRKSFPEDEHKQMIAFINEGRKRQDITGSIEDTEEVEVIRLDTIFKQKDAYNCGLFTVLHAKMFVMSILHGYKFTNKDYSENKFEKCFHFFNKPKDRNAFSKSFRIEDNRVRMLLLVKAIAMIQSDCLKEGSEMQSHKWDLTPQRRNNVTLAIIERYVRIGLRSFYLAGEHFSLRRMIKRYFQDPGPIAMEDIRVLNLLGSQMTTKFMEHMKDYFDPTERKKPASPARRTRSSPTRSARDVNQALMMEIPEPQPQAATNTLVVWEEPKKNRPKIEPDLNQRLPDVINILGDEVHERAREYQFPEAVVQYLITATTTIANLVGKFPLTDDESRQWQAKTFSCPCSKLQPESIPDKDLIHRCSQKKSFPITNHRSFRQHLDTLEKEKQCELHRLINRFMQFVDPSSLEAATAPKPSGKQVTFKEESGSETDSDTSIQANVSKKKKSRGKREGKEATSAIKSPTRKRLRRTTAAIQRDYSEVQPMEGKEGISRAKEVFKSSAWLKKIKKEFEKKHKTDAPFSLEKVQNMYQAYQEKHYFASTRSYNKALDKINEMIAEKEEKLEELETYARNSAKGKYTEKIILLTNRLGNTNPKPTPTETKRWEKELTQAQKGFEEHIKRMYNPHKLQVERMKENKKSLAALEVIGAASEVRFVPEHQGKKEHFVFKFSQEYETFGTGGLQEMSTDYVEEQYDIGFVYSIVKHAQLNAWLDVDSEKKIICDDRPIAKVRAYQIDNKTYGYKGLVQGNPTVLDLPELWVFNTFDQSYIDQLHNEANSGAKWIQIPPGAPNENEIDPEILLDNAPTVRYRQGSKAYCLFYAVASCMDFIGFKHLGSKLVSAARTQSSSGDFKKIVKKIVLENVRFFQAKEYKESQYDPFECQSEYPSFLILQGEDGAINHAVAMVGCWIFDANLPKALELNPTNLDWCVSTSRVKTKFKNVYYAMQFREDSRRVKKRYKSPFT